MKRLLCAVALIGCSTEQAFVAPEGGWQRMQDQPRYDAFEPSAFFPDGRTMQAPPEGTLPRDASLGSSDIRLGYTKTVYAKEIPVRLSNAALERGHERYDIFCAPCHGVLGDANAVVAHNFPLVSPRPLTSGEALDYPPGRIFRAINEGYGMMGSYAAQLSVIDRWSVVAYVRALQIASARPLATLPEAVQREAKGALR